MASVVYSFVSREAVADNFAIGGRVLEVEVRSSVFVRARVRGYIPPHPLSTPFRSCSKFTISLPVGLLVAVGLRVPNSVLKYSDERRCVKRAIWRGKCVASMNWCKLRAVVYSAEMSPGCEGMLVSGAEA